MANIFNDLQLDPFISAKNWNWDIKANHKTVFAQALEFGFESDIIFILGKERIPAHRFILSIFSPYLHVAIKNSTNGICVLSDIEPSLFKLMLKFMYTGELEATKVQAISLLEMALSLKVTGLMAECHKILMGNLELENTNQQMLKDMQMTIENGIEIFQQAMKSENRRLIASSLNYICEHGPQFLESKNFINLRKECLVEIVKQDRLRVDKEMQVFEAVCRWGEAEATRKNLELAFPETMRKVLEKVLQYVRFPLMNQLEISQAVAKNKNILTTDEVVSLFVYFTISEDKRADVPEGNFITTPRVSYAENEGIVYLETPTFNYAETNLPKMFASCAVYDGEDNIYIVGGYSRNSHLKCLNSIYKFSIVTQKIEKVGILPVSCCSGTCFWDGEGIVYFGGSDGNKNLYNKIFRYVPGMSVAAEVGQLPTANQKSSIVSIKPGKALILGGYPVKRSVIHYSKEGVKELPYMLPQNMNGHSSTYYSNKTESPIFLFDKWSIYKYDVETGTTLTIDPLPISISDSTAVSVGKYSYIFGGSGGKSTGVIRFDTKLIEAVEISVSNFPTNLSDSSAVYVKKQNRAYLFGGMGIQDSDRIMYVQF